MTELVISRVDGLDASVQEKDLLHQVFELCLAIQPEHRSEIGFILKLLQSVLPVTSTSLWENSETQNDSAKARPLISARFQVARAVPQLCIVDFRVRHQIFQCLQRLVEDSSGDDGLGIYEEARLQLAFCYVLGFGVAQSDSEAAITAAQTQKESILDQLSALKASKNHGYNPSAVFGSWLARGLVSTTIDAQYYRGERSLTSVLAVNRREIADWVTVLGSSHWIILEKVNDQQILLEGVALLDEAEKIAQDTFDELYRVLPETDFLVVRQKYALARAVYMQGKLDMAKKLVKEIIRDSKVTSDEIDVTKLNHERLLAFIYSSQGKKRKAISLMESLSERIESAFGPNNVLTLVDKWNPCEMLRQDKQIKKAIPLTKQLLLLAKSALGDEHEVSILVKIGLATMQWQRRTWPGGFNGPRNNGLLRMDLIKTSRELLGNDHPFTLEVLKVTVKNLVMKARFPEAIALQEEVIRLSERLPGPTHSHTIERKQQLVLIKKMYGGYRMMERIGTLNIGQYTVTPAFRVRNGLELICWPLYRNKDVTDFVIDLSIGLHEI